MSLPIQLSYAPRAWRTDQFVIPIRCWQDRAKTKPVDLTAYGSAWLAEFRPDWDSLPVGTFTIDVSMLDQGQITLSLDSTSTTYAALPLSNYVFDVRVSGGVVTPLTVFVGRFIVDGVLT